MRSLINKTCCWLQYPNNAAHVHVSDISIVRVLRTPADARSLPLPTSSCMWRLGLPGRELH